MNHFGGANEAGNRRIASRRHLRSGRAMLTANVVALLAACGDAADAGLLMVPEWTLEPEMRIDGDEHELVPVSWIAVGEDGTIAVAQAQNHAVRLFGEAGDPLLTFGRAGQGPGEFGGRALSGGWFGEGFWVFDMMLGRITTASAGGELLGTTSLPRPARYSGEPGSGPVDFMLVSPLAYRGDGSIIAHLEAPQGEDMESWQGMAAYARLSMDGEVQKLLARYELPWTMLVSCGGAGGLAMGMGTMLRDPFPNTPLFEAARNGSRLALVMASIEGEEAGSFRVVLLDEAGDTIYDRRHPFDPVPITAAEAANQIDPQVERMNNCSGGAGDEFRRRVEVPAIYPPFQSLVLGADGSLWLRRRDAEEERSYLVLDPSGDRVGQVRVPPNVQIRAANAEHAWATELDEFDVPSVVRYRLVRDG